METTEKTFDEPFMLKHVMYEWFHQFFVKSTGTVNNTITVEAMLLNDDDHPVYCRLINTCDDKGLHNVTKMLIMSYWYTIEYEYDYGWPWNIGMLIHDVIRAHRGYMLTVAPMACGDWSEERVQDALKEYQAGSEHKECEALTESEWNQQFMTCTTEMKRKIRKLKLERVKEKV